MTAELAATSDPEVDQRKLAVLLVDDHEVVHLGFRLMLTRTAWISRLVSARTIDEAVALARRYEPHVALVDLMLGEASGADACEAVRAACPKTRVLLMSGSGRIGTSTAQAIGASGFVPKDWATADILRAVYTVGTGGTMFLPRAETVGAGLSQRERNVLELRRLRRDEPRDRRPHPPLAAHGQGASELPLPQARRAQPRRCGPARAAPRAAQLTRRACPSPSERPMTSFMISLEPAQIFVTRASTQARATSYSSM